MNIQLSDHFTYRKLLRFVFPSIIMMIFTSIYGVVDGIFVSNFVGTTPFAAINLIMPFLMILGALGFMIGTGGSALISKTLGEGETKKANELFSMLIYFTIISGIILSIIGLFMLRPISIFFGAEGQMLEDCIIYGRILLPFTFLFMLQCVFQSFAVTAEKPQFGMYVTIGAGVINMVLDALFVGVFRWGLVGAAMATAFSQVVGGIIPLVYFAVTKKSVLHLGKACFSKWALLRTCTNGSSELMTNVAISLVSIIYNFQLIRFAGEDGVAAYGVIMYVNFIFIAVFLGYSIGCAPIIGFHYGAGNEKELQGMLRKSLVIITVFSIILTGVAEILAGVLADIFVGYDAALFAMTRHAFRIYSVSFLFAGFSIFGSAFFTALNNGLVSAAISFLRALLFQVAAVLLLPLILGLDGIWWAITVAEVMAMVMSAICLVKMRDRYHYY